MVVLLVFAALFCLFELFGGVFYIVCFWLFTDWFVVRLFCCLFVIACLVGL